jgi:hypothetical protein
MDPKGSFKNLGGRWYVACWECNKGINGRQSCKNGMVAKNLKQGCYNGLLLDKYTKDGEVNEGD